VKYECAILSSGACLARQHFTTLSHEWYDFLDKIIAHKMCVFIFSARFLKKKFSFLGTGRNIVKNFDVLLTVNLNIILVIDQLNAQILVL